MEGRLEMKQENVISSKGRETRATANLLQVMSFTAPKEWLFKVRDELGLLQQNLRVRFSQSWIYNRDRHSFHHPQMWRHLGMDYKSIEAGQTLKQY